MKAEIPDHSAVGPRAAPPRPRRKAFVRWMPLAYVGLGLAWLALTNLPLRNLIDDPRLLSQLLPAATFLLVGAALLHLLQRRPSRAESSLAWRCDRAVFEDHPDPLLLHDPQTLRIVDANPPACALLRHPRETLQQMTLTSLLAPDSLADGEAWPRGSGAVRLRTADDDWVSVESHSVEGRLGDRTLCVSLIRDQAETGRIRDELAASNRELQAMARRLFSLQEDERRAISRDLHDDVGQAITAIKMSAHAAMDEDDAGRRRRDLAEIVETADTTVDKLRNLSMLLRPPQLDALGLEAALRWHAGVLFRSAPTGLHLDLDVSALPRRPAREIEQACFRVAQECLTNALRHASAGLVTLRLHDHGDGFLQLHVGDDGDGFEPEHARGLGLVIMRERAQSAGGSLQIDTGPGEGTRIRLLLPYRVETASEVVGAMS